MAGSEAIGAGIAASDNDHALAGRQNLRFRFDGIAQIAPVLLRQELHREMDSFQLASGDIQIARLLGSAGEHSRIEIAEQILYRDILAYLRAGNEFHALGGHLFQAAINDVLLHLELGDAIAQQPANAVRFFVNHHGVSGAAQLLGRGQSRGARTHDCHFFPGADFWRLGPDPAFVKPALHDIFFNLLDCDWRLVDPEHTRRFTRRWTNPAGEFREVVGRVQLPDRLFPTSVINEIVPIGNQIVDRTPRLAKGHATVHAARALGAKIRFGKIEIDFKPIVDALSNRTSRGKLARVFQESRVLTHVAPARPGPSRRRAGS